jgi:hypothetical protein
MEDPFQVVALLLPLSVLRTCVNFVDKVLFITYQKIVHLFDDN